MAAAQRNGFWTAVAIATLYVVSMFFDPVTGMICAALFFVLAFGILHGHTWAAIAAAVIVGVPLIFTLLSWMAVNIGDGREVTSAVVNTAILGICEYFFVRAALDLSRRPAAEASARALRWPWLTILAMLAVGWICVQPLVMPTISMQNTILIGDHLLVDTLTPMLGRLPERGDLVVVRVPVAGNAILVKRVVGVAGDRLKLVDKQLWRNGKQLNEPYVIHSDKSADAYRDNFPSGAPVPALPDRAINDRMNAMLHSNVVNGEVVVPANSYFVMGDNRDASLDSRYWGFVAKGDVLGRPVLIYASYSLGSGTRGPFAVPSVLNMRWDRLFKRPG